jgi:hypothetical protein
LRQNPPAQPQVQAAGTIINDEDVLVSVIVMAMADVLVGTYADLV